MKACRVKAYSNVRYWFVLVAAILMNVCVGNTGEAAIFHYDQVKSHPPQEFTLVDQCVEGFGTAWAVAPPMLPGQAFLAQNPVDPKLGYHNGALIAIEYRIPQLRIFEGQRHAGADKAYELISGVMFDHIDIVHSRGTGDIAEPHYAIRFYYVSHDEHQGYCAP